MKTYEELEREAIQNEHLLRRRVVQLAKPSEDPRPLIRLGPELHEIVDRAITALRTDPDLYQRDGSLVHVTRVDGEANTDDSKEDRKFLAPGTPQIRRMPLATLRERLTRAARWERLDKRNGEWQRIFPTDPIVQAVLNRGEWAGIRPIVGVIETPALRPDGSVISTPGYDAATGFLYLPNSEYPPVPEAPSQEDARRAWAELFECFAEFPYKSEAHRSTAIAAILTLIARPAIQGSVPAFLFDAAAAGSGKTLQTDAVSLVATGRTSAKMGYPADNTELEKVLGAYAIRGTALINFDNVNRPFGGGPLDRCLTAEDTVELRILGKSEIPALRWRSVIITTGNNITVSGDTTRRVLFARIESDLENPEDRTGFKHEDLLGWVRAERPRLVCAALTLLRAFFVAGQPRGGCKTWGSFEPWARLIPPAIVFAGGADPMLTRPSVEGEEDEEKQALAVVLRYWPRLDPTGNGITAKTAIGVLYPIERLRGQQLPPDGFDELREAIEVFVPTRPGTAPDPTRLGYKFASYRARVVGGRKLVSEAAGQGVKRWKVVAVSKSK